MSEPTPQATATWRARTIKVIVAAVILLGGYDIVAYRAGGQDATITQVIRDNSAEWAMIPLLAGILYGHLFWAGGANKKESE